VAADDPVIVGVGMVTAIGLSAAETAASVRAGTMRFSESSIRDQRFQPFTLAEVLEDGLPAVDEEISRTPGLTSRAIRLLRLGTVALNECLSTFPSKTLSPGLVLALPEFQPANPIDGPGFIAKFARQIGPKFDASRSFAVDAGRAGSVVAIARAAETIRSGQAAFALAGGIDSYRDLLVLATLDKEKRVKSAVHLDGFIPGEAAAFLLLASASAAAATGLKPIASLSRVAQGIEEGHLYSEQPYRGEGLAATIGQIVQAKIVPSPFAEVWSSMNGESHWGKEWGVSFLRNKAAFIEDADIQHPADCVGDVGSAIGPLLVGLAALGVRDGYRKSPALVYCSSDRGARAALALTAA
jgi:3-oxoacyl-[acyl-carrier-protein] synthase I